MPHVERVRAENLQPGDVCVGPSIDFTDRGIVKCIEPHPRGVKIHWDPSLETVRPKSYAMYVVKP